MSRARQVSKLIGASNTAVVSTPATFGNTVTVATSGITFGDSTTQVTAPSAFGFKNKIINGSFSVWQRSTSWTRNQLSNAEFAADRFWIYSYAASSGTVDRSTDVPAGEGFVYSLANNLNANVPYGTNVELSATGSPQPFVVGNTYTLSFWIKAASATSGLTMNINWRNVHADGTNSTQAVAAYPTYSATTSWTRVVLTFTLNVSPHANNKVLDFETVFPAGSKVTGWQLEAGPTATAFDHRPIGMELALCQRYYYQQSSLGGYFPFGFGYEVSTTVTHIGITFPVTMRISPTFTSSAATTFYVQDAASNRQASAIALQTSSPTCASVSLTMAGGTAGVGAKMLDSGSPAYVGFSSEM